MTYTVNHTNSGVAVKDEQGELVVVEDNQYPPCKNTLEVLFSDAGFSEAQQSAIFIALGKEPIDTEDQ